MAGKASGHHYKIEWVENERLRQELSIVNWIYIGVDTRFSNMAKIGLTTSVLGTRASGSQNPFYSLFCAFKIKEGVRADVVKNIEDSIISLLSKNFQRISHVTTGRYSEWFYAAPQEMRVLVNDFLYDMFNSHMYSVSANKSAPVFPVASHTH
ncbi:MAG: GIY-YIG nuclease family protein [Balneolales bacterium]